MEFQKFIKIGLFYTVTKYVVIGLNTIRSLLIAFILGPEKLGLYGFVILLLEYLNYSNLGVFYSLNKEVALNLGNEAKNEYINKNINTALTFQIYNSLLISFIVLIFYFTKIDFVGSDYLPYIAVLGFIYSIKTFLFVYFRLFEKFIKIIKIEFFTSLFALILILFLVQRFEIHGILFASVLGNIIFVFPYLFSIKSLKMYIDFRILKNLIIVGVPLLIFNLFILAITSIDRFIIGYLNLSSLAALGYYHFGYLLSFGVFTAFNAIAFLLVPKILKQQNEEGENFSLVKLQTNIIELVVVILITAAIIFVPLAINFLLPNYSISIPVMQYLLIGYLINAFAFIPSNFLIARDHHKILILILLVSILIATVLNFLALSYGFGIYGVALATIVTFAVNSLGVFITYLKKIDENISVNILSLFWRLGLFSLISSIIIWDNYNNLWIIFLFFILYLKKFKEVYEALLNKDFLFKNS